MRKPLGMGSKFFFFSWMLCCGAPPPGLVDERSVGRVHKADDAVVDADGHFGLKVGEVVFLAKLLDGGSGLAGFDWLGESGARRDGIGEVDPYEIVLLFARKTSGVDAIDFHGLIRGERGDQLALAVVNIELPSVIRALEILTIEFSGIERHAAMGAGIAQGEGMSLTIAADDEGNLKQRGFMQLVAMDAVGGQGAIPEAGEHQRVGGLALREIEFGHGSLIVDC